MTRRSEVVSELRIVNKIKVQMVNGSSNMPSKKLKD